MATDPRKDDKKTEEGEIKDEKLEDVAGGRTANLGDKDGEGSPIKPRR